MSARAAVRAERRPKIPMMFANGSNRNDQGVTRKSNQSH
jgi:hypothetical protein